MHANIAKAPARAVYVPAPKRPTAQKAEPRRTRMAPKDAVTPIATLMRSVAWTGEPAPTLKLVESKSRERFGAHLRARDLFAQVAWTGGATEAPTEDQLKNSVKAVFDAFGWE